MSIKMIGLDLDGTTLNNDGIMTERTKKAFVSAMEKGVHIIVATGRAIHSLPKDLFDIKGLEYTITSNGARIIEMKEKSTIRASFINEETVRRIHNFLKERDAMIEIFCEGRAFISRSEYENIVGGGPTRRSRKYVKESRTPVDDIYSMLWEKADHIENISINYFEKEEKAEMEKSLSEIPGMTLTSSFPYNNEIGGVNTSKAEALKYMMEKLSVSPEELMCCGDSLNDMAMIKLAGIGVAMENASDEVKKIADYITSTNHDDGVANAIEKFAL